MEAVLQRRSAHSHVACNIEKLVGMREGGTGELARTQRMCQRYAGTCFEVRLQLHQRYADTRFGEQRQRHLPQKHKATDQDTNTPARASESMRSAPEGGQERGRNGVKSKRSRAYTINTIYCGCRPNRTVVQDPPRGHAYQNSRGLLRASAALMGSGAHRA